MSDPLDFDDLRSDGYYYENCFNEDREGYFHYCVFCHALKDKPTACGWAEDGGDAFCIVHPTWIISSVPYSFIHELGHNILGDSPYDSHRDSDGHCKELFDDCTMYSIPGVMENYCENCWDDLDLAYCF